MNWKDLSGPERYRVLDLARKGEMSIREICQAFGVSRQALSRAMERADQASIEALEPRRPGRKPKPEGEVKSRELVARQEGLEKELAHWKQKYEVARTFLELERKLERGERLPGEEGQRGKKTKGKVRRKGRKK